MDIEYLYSLKTIEPDEALRLVAATVLGALIGLERQFHQKNAGVRTHALLALMGAQLLQRAQ